MAGWRLLLPFVAPLLLAACGRGDEGALQVAFIDSSEEMLGDGVRLSAGAQHLRAATGAGLVTLNAQGEVVPALADRWIVTDDGRSFIFRLRDGAWPDGRELTAESVHGALLAAIRAVEGTSLGLDLEPIDEVRAMAGQVIEIRLSTPVPMLLQLLAQPEMTLGGEQANALGDMQLGRQGDAVMLTMKPPASRGLPETEDWRRYVRALAIRPVAGEEAVSLFDNGQVDLVLGGRLGTMPLADTGPLSRGTVQLDPALGLFGLRVLREEGLLETPLGREALAMAIDRLALVAPFNIAGWVPTTRLVAPGLPDDPGQIAERWSGRPIEELRAEAASRVTAWRNANGGAEARLVLAIDRAPGLDMLFAELARQFAAVGVRLERASTPGEADLVLIDRVARYADPRWFLNQFHCSLGGGMCHSGADALVDEAAGQEDAAARLTRLAEAEARLTVANVYIPFGSPLRFSLVRSNVTGFAPNAWGFHPLPAFAQIPR